MPAREPGGTKNIEEARKRTAVEKAAKKAKAANGGVTPQWWPQTDPNKAALLAGAAIKRRQTMDTRRLWDLGYFATLYDYAELGFAGSLLNRSFKTRAPYANPLAATFNGCKVCVDTVTNTVTEHKPVAQFVATDGNWKSHKIAKMRNRAVAGWFFEQGIYEKTATEFRDSGVWGRGVLHVFERGGRPVCERVFPGDLFVPQAASINGEQPREMARTHLVDRHQVWRDYEGDAAAQAAIARASQVKITVDGLLDDEDDLIIINKAWRLPSYPGAGDGKYLVATEEDALEFAEWKHDNFPFVFIDCSEATFGFWPPGMVQDLAQTQLQYNDLSYTINTAMQHGGFQLFINSASNIVAEALDNEIGGYIRGDGEPKSLLWQLVQPELLEREREIRKMFFDISGVSQMVSSNEKPAPDESGIAIRERVAIYDERHAKWGQSYQNAHLTLARLFIQTTMDILERATGSDDPKEWRERFLIQSTRGTYGEPIDFAELGFKPGEQFTIQCMAAADLPDTVEGRVALAEQFVNNGWYDEATARQAFLAPYDVQRVETLFNAAYDWYSRILDEAVEHGTPCPDPSGNDQLQLALGMALQHRMYALCRDVPLSHIDEVEKYITKVKLKLTDANQAAQQMTAMPLANPKPAPTSGLLPNPNAPSAQA